MFKHLLIKAKNQILADLADEKALSKAASSVNDIQLKISEVTENIKKAQDALQQVQPFLATLPSDKIKNINEFSREHIELQVKLNAFNSRVVACYQELMNAILTLPK